ncbi:MAG TPA: amino acid--tRNA ligase-related protein [Lachnospiraceae bacterium]|nr:amino acid--tRNA ligase-related protein [Lachnospiraceae bacterium]
MNNILKHLQDPVVKRSLSMADRIKFVTREFLMNNGFEEYDTPILTPKTGERYNSTFDITIDDIATSLADSPQIFKLMLSMAGYERYYQYAHCFRPIESKSDNPTRLCEFTQIDIEMQHTTFSELIRFAENIIIVICKAFKIEARIRHVEGLYCRDTYGMEMKPDLRDNEDELSVVFIEHMPLTNGERTEYHGLIPCHHIFALPSDGMQSTEEEVLINAVTESFDIVMNGIEIGGGDLRIMNSDLQQRMMDIFDVDKIKYSEYLEMLNSNTGKQGGGFAIGLERLVMVLSGCDDIHQTVCFPDFYRRSEC